MAGIIDVAYVEVLPDLKAFDKQATKEIKAALADAGKEADKAAAQIEKSFSDAGKSVTSSVGVASRSLEEMQADAAKSAREYFRATKSAAEDLAKDVDKATRSAATGVRKSTSIFKNEGGNLGSSLAGGIISGATKGLSTLGSSVSSAISAAGPYVQGAAVALGITVAAATAPAIAAIGLALPAAAGVGIAAIGTLTLGFQGLGDAIENAGDPEKFAEALEKLSPAAQRFAIEIKNLMPILSSIRAAAQEGLFKGFEGELTRVITTLQGPLRTGFNEVGRSIRGLLAELADLAVAGKSTDTLNELFATTARIIKDSTPSMQIFLGGIGDLVRKALPFVEQLAGGFAGFLEKIGDGLSSAAENGGLDEIFSKGLEVLTKLWDIGKELWPVLKGILGVGVEAGGPALDGIKMFAEAIGDIFKDKENLQALGVIFQGLGYVLQFVALQVKLVTIVFSSIIDATTWLTRQVIRLAKAFPDFARSVGDAVSDAWEAVASFFSDIGSAISDFVSSVGDWFADAWDTVVTGIMDAFNAVITFFTELPGRILNILKVIPGLVLGALATALKAALQAIGVAIGLILFAVLELPKRIPGYLAQLWDIVSTFFVNLWNSVAEWTISAWNSLLAWLAALPGRIVAAISSLWSRLSAFFVSLWEAVSTWTVNAWNSMIAWFVALPGRIVAAVSSLWNALSSFFSKLWNDVRTWAINGWNSVIDWIKSVPGRIAALGQTFYNAGLGLIRGFFNGLSQAAGFAGSVGSSIFSAFKGALNWAIRQINSGIAYVDDVLPGSLPRIPLLAKGGLALGPSMIGEAGKEIALPLQGQRGRKALELLADAANGSSGAAITFGPGAIAVSFESVIPTEQQAYQTGEAVGRGILGVLAQRTARVQMRTA